MIKRFLALILTAALIAVAFTGCLKEDEPKTTGSETTGAHRHVPENEGKYDNTDEENHYYVCAECGESVTEKHVSKLFYNVNGHYYSCDCHWKDGNLEEHALENGKCTVCDWESDADHQHSFRSGGPISDDAHELLCDCGKTVSEEHTFSYDIKDSYHALMCECGYRGDMEDHARDENGVCTVCGNAGHVCDMKIYRYDSERHYSKCDCGSESSGTHFFGVGFARDDSGHYAKCGACDHIESAEAHSFFNGVYISDSCSVCEHPFPESKGLIFEEVDGGYSLVSFGSCADKLIVVPSTYNGQPVVAVGGSAFEGNADVVCVKLPDSVKSIGSSAFAGCSSLVRVNIPSGVQVIRDNTFMGCTSLKGVVCPDPESLTEVEMYAFSGCAAFEGFVSYERGEDMSFEISPAVIGDFAFYGCSSLKGDIIDLVECEYIGNGAFSGCASIKSIFILNCQLLGGDAFSGCTSLKTVEIEGRDFECFDVNTFASCTALTTLRLYGDAEDWYGFFADSVYDEEMGLSWNEGCPDFTVEFLDFNTSTEEYEVTESMKHSELYSYIEENYWGE